MSDQVYIPKAGLNNVGSYQVSSIPFLTSTVAPAFGNTPAKVSFPTVTRFVTIKNIDLNANRRLRVGFSENGVNTNNYLILTQHESFTADFKITSVFLVSEEAFAISASVVAGLTGIDSTQLSTNWSGSLGVG